MADRGDDRTHAGEIYWECQDCGERFWKSKSACLNCGSGRICTQTGSEGFTSFLRRMSIPEFLALILGIAALFILVFFATVFIGL